MHRFHVAPGAAGGPGITLPESEAYHAARVLRVQPGDRVTVLDGAGQQLQCEVHTVTKREVTLTVRERIQIPPLPYQLTLLAALPKGRLMDDIVEKATELGTARIVPVLTERTVSQLAEGGAEAKVAKWRHTAVEAIKQCGSAWLPRVETPVTLAHFLGRGEPFDLMLVASLHAGARAPRAILQQHLAAHGRVPVSVALWIGPEGDFTPAELAALAAAGAQPMTLGPLVLRCATAAVAALAVVGCELQSASGRLAPTGRTIPAQGNALGGRGGTREP